MVKHLHTAFLSSADAYAQAEAFWRDLWADVVGELGQTQEWHSPWFNTAFVNGTSFRDGNPIFSALAPLRNLGARVIQYEPSSEGPELDWWVDTFGAAKEDKGIRELIISCALSDEVVGQVRHLLRQWVRQGEIAASQEGLPFAS